MHSISKLLGFTQQSADYRCPDGITCVQNHRLRSRLAQAEQELECLRSQAGLKSTERDSEKRHERLLLEEMHHRIKNTLAIVMAIVSQSLKAAPSLEEGRLAVQHRLIALSAAQDGVLRAKWEDTKLTDVIHSVISTFDEAGGRRFEVGACDLDIGSAAVLPICLTLNELCTNAVKYGALSTEKGLIGIEFESHPESQTFRMRWSEIDGPPVEVPAKHSFGSRLIAILAKRIEGNAATRYEPDGLIFTLDVPLASLHRHALG